MFTVCFPCAEKWVEICGVTLLEDCKRREDESQTGGWGLWQPISAPFSIFLDGKSLWTSTDIHYSRNYRRRCRWNQTTFADLRPVFFSTTFIDESQKLYSNAQLLQSNRGNSNLEKVDIHMHLIGRIASRHNSRTYVYSQRAHSSYSQKPFGPLYTCCFRRNWVYTAENEKHLHINAETWHSCDFGQNLQRNTTACAEQLQKLMTLGAVVMNILVLLDMVCSL